MSVLAAACGAPGRCYRQNMMNANEIVGFGNRKTPFYLYDMRLLSRTLDEIVRLSSDYGIEVHYAVKANANVPVLRRISSKGLGADCVSGNEILFALENGFPAGKTVFSGVGKTDREIELAISKGVFSINCESLPEIRVVNEIASGMGKKANVSVRINPDIDAHTHKYITTGLEENKFGISRYEFEELVKTLGECESIDFNGLHFHIGSQITDVADVFALECRRAAEIVSWFESKGLEIRNINLGGGLGIDYEEPQKHPVPDFAAWMRTIARTLPRKEGVRVHIEPGRSVVAQCGILCTRVLYVKEGQKKTFLITDAGMNDLIRPALYGAYHKIRNITAEAENRSGEKVYDVVGPVCESSDVWGEDRTLPASRRGDLLAICSAGAYGQVMASRYNLRDLAEAEYID